MTPGVLSGRSVEIYSESAHARPTYENLAYCDHTNLIEKRKTANENERLKLSIGRYVLPAVRQALIIKTCTSHSTEEPQHRRKKENNSYTRSSDHDAPDLLQNIQGAERDWRGSGPINEGGG
ncbi:hypothetical protein EVAR_29683_1 [Eumeta japonica]|uniref:Uncharacterized protein n=1 Tax=Eumeta variegata TaxID=151549 RepID=A0A4C1VZG8_EUMVA|nr:hypothetical protein EVAR_29683_1 [Eumeta japonica]